MSKAEQKPFSQTKKLGEMAELRVKWWLREEHPTLRKIEGEFSGYDLIDDEGYKVEVKLDLESSNTGNIAIEYSSMGKKTGIAITTADDWVHIFSYQNRWLYLVVGVGELKEFLANNWNTLRKTSGGYKGYSMMVLVPTELVVKEFRPHSV